MRLGGGSAADSRIDLHLPSGAGPRHGFVFGLRHVAWFAFACCPRALFLPWGFLVDARPSVWAALMSMICCWVCCGPLHGRKRAQPPGVMRPGRRMASVSGCAVCVGYIRGTWETCARSPLSCAQAGAWHEFRVARFERVKFAAGG